MKGRHLTIRHARCILLGACVASSGCGDDGDEDSSASSLLPEVPANVAIGPVVPCTVAGIGATELSPDAPVTIWPQLVMNVDLGAPIAPPKLELVTQRAIASCDDLDGLGAGVIDDPRACQYAPSSDATITRASWTGADLSCLTPAEARAVEKIWGGARTTRRSSTGRAKDTTTLSIPGRRPLRRERQYGRRSELQLRSGAIGAVSVRSQRTRVSFSGSCMGQVH